MSVRKPKDNRKTVSELLKQDAAFGKNYSLVFIIQGGAIRRYVGKDAKDLTNGSLFQSIARVKTFSECGAAMCICVE